MGVFHWASPCEHLGAVGKLHGPLSPEGVKPHDIEAYMAGKDAFD